MKNCKKLLFNSIHLHGFTVAVFVLFVITDQIAGIISEGNHVDIFIYRGWEVHSEGNPHCHAILRGSTNKHGNHLQNYHYEDLLRLCDAIEDGCQKIGEGIYGQSITDPCLGWEKTEKLIYDIADAIK